MPRNGSPLRGRVGAQRSSAEISISERFVRTAWMLDLRFWARACTSPPQHGFPPIRLVQTSRALLACAHRFQGKGRDPTVTTCACCQLLGKILDFAMAEDATERRIPKVSGAPDPLFRYLTGDGR